MAIHLIIIILSVLLPAQIELYFFSCYSLTLDAINSDMELMGLFSIALSNSNMPKLQYRLDICP